MQTITIKLNSSTSNFTLKVENGEYQVASNGDYTLSVARDQVSNTQVAPQAVESIRSTVTADEASPITPQKKVENTSPTKTKPTKALKGYTDKTVIKTADGKPLLITIKPTNKATYDIKDFPYTDQTKVYFIEKVKDMPGKKRATVMEQWDGLDKPYTTYRLYKDVAANLDKYKHLDIVAAQVQVLRQDEFFGVVVLNTNLEKPSGDYWYGNQNLKKEAAAVYDGMDYSTSNPPSVVSKYLDGVECFKLNAVGRIADYTPVKFSEELLKDSKVSMFKFKCGAGNIKPDHFIAL